MTLSHNDPVALSTENKEDSKPTSQESHKDAGTLVAHDYSGPTIKK